MSFRTYRITSMSATIYWRTQTFIQLRMRIPPHCSRNSLSNYLKNRFNTHHLQTEIRITDLLNRYPVPSRFYTLPKIHKPGSPPPGRPIVSSNGSVTEIISSFVDHFLKELVPSLDSYIQDTADFLNTLEKVKAEGPLPPGTLMIVADVVSLYTNIPHSEGLEACEIHLNKRASQTIPTPFLLSLIQFVLTKNNFFFSNRHFIQTQGTAMGTKMAPSYACLFMGVLEERILGASPLQPKLWKRFIDDVFILWTHGREKWEEFLHHLNASHATIKFVASVSDASVPFLDVLVGLNNGILDTDIYFKQTDSHNFLPYDSCHPTSTMKGVPLSQALRYRRICSQDRTFHIRLYQLEGFLRSAKYPVKNIKQAFAQVKSMSRESTLLYRNPRSNTRITLPITFHPNLRRVPSTVLDKHKNILLHDPRNKAIFPEPAMVAFRRPRNLRDIITRASITRPQPALEPGFRDCDRMNCGMHIYTRTGNTFQSKVTSKIYHIRQFLDCNSHNIIYLVTCRMSTCGLQYVGQTGRALRDRCPEHIRDIKSSKEKPVPLHFNLPFHSLEHFSIQAIEKCTINTIPYREAREQHWKNILQAEINVR